MVYTPFYFLLFVLLFPFHTFAQNNSTIAAGSTLTATDNTKPWLSPSGEFACGFSQIQGTNQFLVCIWYAKINERTIVWHANTTSPVPQGSTLRLDAEFGLILRDPQGNRLWTTDGFVDKVAYGFLNDTGKFVLSRNDSRVLWDTFAHPTDTLLPTQEMEIGSMLISRRSEANFSLGRFYLRMPDNGNLVLSSKMVSTNSDYDADYYNSQTSDTSNPTNSGYKVIFSEKGSVSILKRNNATQELTPRSVSSVTENYLRLTLNFDGVLTLYRYPKGSAGNLSWIPLWSQPDNICTKITGDKGSGACGYNSVCSIDANQRPSCNCPRGYSLLDPSDQYGSCQPNYVQTCGKPANGSSEELFSLIEITDTDWPLSDFEQINPSNKDDCRTACLNDCLCAVAIFRSNTCWKKKLPLSNGRIDTTLDATAFIKVGKGDAPPLSPDPWREFPERKKDQGNLILAGSVLLGSSVFVNVLLLTALLFGFFFIYKKKIKAFAPTNLSVPSNLQYFSYQCLAEATNQFKEEVGRGAFGIVYKGEMPVGSGNIVAVKKLDRVAHDTDKEFKTEVNVIGQTHHKNLVRLLGYCDEGQHRMLVYEYMPNGTLATFLFNDLKPSWSQRTKIALGVAHGLTYLHEECSTQIIHCDIKPQNILLDDYYAARISDFGLAKLLMMNQSRTYTNIRGTKGYVAPEWFRNNQVTVKVDVYSFGVLLMEIIACRRSLEDEEICGADKAVLADWFTDCFHEKRLELLVEDDAEALCDMETLKRFVMTAIWCIQEDASLRPTMKRVSQMLEGAVEVLVPPVPYPLTSITTYVSLE
ncbi:PREDICTED: G-type lectin S-receptor-like serine/threonine-protein kinase RLK1 [Ipomoea nil]|uniref:G-type lectin S-receptor-like serine/threonine-protein kinase RLK1 n=1 Tax=Ipomoea nil TaxID=35883 RepID=UPI00090154B4|nr:PREDICTED: G-type lectin S-receptor-like serine/threonine-protein kinase RLK1 [Ipomoea nil]